MIRLHNGDCLNILKMMIEDEVFVDSIVTDPPYHLNSIVERFGKDNSAPAQYGTDGAFKRASTGFMGKEWDGGDIAFRQETWELCLKVLKPGGHLLAFSASRNYHRMAVAIEDAGFEIRDQIMWLYGSGFPKSMNIGKAIDKKLGNKRESLGTNLKKAGDMRSGNYDKGGDYDDIELEITKGNSEWEGWGTALKPAHEPLVLARKPLSEKSVVDNVLKHRTGGINIDECRVEGNDAKYPDTNPDFRDQGRQSKENMGIDKLSFGQTENVKRKVVVRKTRTDDSVFNNGNSSFRAEGTLYADADPRGRFPSNVMHDGSDSIKELFEDKSRYFYCAKTSKAERNQGLDNFIKKNKVFNGQSPNASKDMKGVEQKFTTKPSANTHPTVKPIKLMKYLCRLITPKGGTILDPFMGSGSTGMAAKEENFDFVGIEKEEEYFNIATARIESVETKSTLEDFYD
jgi:site-specific DNA-methyltransferase (adenine-specific)